VNCPSHPKTALQAMISRKSRVKAELPFEVDGELHVHDPASVSTFFVCQPTFQEITMENRCPHWWKRTRAIPCISSTCMYGKQADGMENLDEEPNLVVPDGVMPTVI
jgi:hypothetical protein